MTEACSFARCFPADLGDHRLADFSVRRRNQVAAATATEFTDQFSLITRDDRLWVVKSQNVTVA